MRPVDVQRTEGDDTEIRRDLVRQTVFNGRYDKLEPGTKVAVTGAGNRPQAAIAPPGRSTE